MKTIDIYISKVWFLGVLNPKMRLFLRKINFDLHFDLQNINFRPFLAFFGYKVMIIGLWKVNFGYIDIVTSIPIFGGQLNL